MYGAPYVTSYDCWQRFVNGQSVVGSQRDTFACSIFERLPEILLDAKSGLFIGAPLILLALAFGLRLFWQRSRKEAILWILTGTSLTILFTIYCKDFPGSIGNRYLMPVVALAAIPLALAIQNCFRARNPEPWNSAPNPLDRAG